MIVSEDMEHVYAVLEQTHLQQPTRITQLNETMLIEQTEQSHQLETVPSDQFQCLTNQAGLTLRSATWASAQPSNVRPKPRHENLEMIQIYDTYCDN